MFQCKVGICKGGICKNYNEVNCNKIKKLRRNIIHKGVNKIHPFSENYPKLKLLIQNLDFKIFVQKQNL